MAQRVVRRSGSASRVTATTVMVYTVNRPCAESQYISKLYRRMCPAECVSPLSWPYVCSTHK